MRHRGRRWIWIASSGLLVGLLGTASLLWLNRPYQVRTLPDGSRVSLERVAIERSTPQFVGAEWQRRLWELSGRQLLLFGQAITTTRAQDTLMLELTGTGVKRSQRFDTGVLLDEHDCVFSGWQRYIPTGPGRSASARAEVSFAAFPRRGGAVRAGFATEGPPVLFEVPVPHTGQPSGWTAEPFPIRKTVGNLEASLTRISPARLPDHLLPRAYFELRQHGRRTAAWVPSSIRASDGTGNTDGLTDLAVEADGGVLFPGLCTREPAWKLETWFAPADPGHTPPDLEWTARNVAMDAAGQLVRSEQMTDRNGITLELLGTAGAGTVEWRPGLYSQSPTPAVRVRATLSPNDEGATLTLVKVTDASGRVLLPRTLSGALPSTVASHREYHGVIVEHDFALRLSNPPAKLSFTFRVHRMKKAQFLAKP